MAAKMSKPLAALALLAAAPLGGCAGLSFEPTANWWRDGGRLCAANRETGIQDGQRDAPRSCAQAEATPPPLGK